MRWATALCTAAMASMIGAATLTGCTDSGEEPTLTPRGTKGKGKGKKMRGKGKRKGKGKGKGRRGGPLGAGLSTFEDANPTPESQKCRWSHIDFKQRRSPLVALDGPCPQRIDVAWHPKDQKAIIDLSGGEAEGLWYVQRGKITQLLGLEEKGTRAGFGFDGEGKPRIFTADGGKVRAWTKQGDADWEQVEEADGTDVGALKAVKGGKGHKTHGLWGQLTGKVVRTEASAEDRAALAGFKDAAFGKGAWLVGTTETSEQFALWEQDGKLALPLVIRTAEGWKKAEGIDLGIDSPFGITVEVDKALALITFDGARPHVYDLKGNKVAYTNPALKGVTFWPIIGDPKDRSKSKSKSKSSKAKSKTAKAKSKTKGNGEGKAKKAP